MSSRSHLSKDFFELVKAIGESKSKQEEDRIIVKEINTLKERFLEKNNSKAKLKEFLVRLIYIEMLGHDASFGYVYAIQLTASFDLLQKRVGYLCSAICLSPDHEFRFMLVNQIQRDLQSSNKLEVTAALVAACKLVTDEMIPAILPIVSKLLKHDQSAVRKKATMVLHRCFQLGRESVQHLESDFRSMLCDKDPSVMGGALCWLHELAKLNPDQHKDLVPSYVSILKQITEHRLPRDFDYHRMPAPWIQIKLLQILAILGRNDQRTSERMYDVISDCIKRADTGINVGYAIVYEAVKTVTAIYPNTKLLDAAAAAISRFITSESHNLKYLGVTGLAAIVRDHPRYAAQHQMVVLDCLEDPDETLKRKTLNLLFRMTNPVNAEVVVEKLIYFLRQGADEYLKRDLVTRITQLAERYAPNNQWYVRTMTTVFELGGDLVESEVAHNLLRLLAEGSEDEDSDREMREEACLLFVDLLEEPVLPEILLNVMCWTLGEYCFLIGEQSMPEVIEKICSLAAGEGISATSRAYGVTALLKMSAQLGVLSPATAVVIDKYASSVSVEVQQRCYEFRELARNMSVMQAVLPVDASCEDLSDVDFSFLSAYAAEQKSQGLPDYSPPKDEDDEDDELEFNKKIETLRYDAYEKPTVPTVRSVTMDTGISDFSNSGAQEATVGGGLSTTTSAASESAKPQTGLNLKGVKSVWGASGYTGTAKSAAPAEPRVDEEREEAMATLSRAAKALQEAGFDLPEGITMQDLEDDLRAREQIESSTSTSTSNAASASTSRYEAAPAVTNDVPPPRPEKPKELTERERMAAALFGGVSSDSSSAAGAKPKPRRKPRASQPKDQPLVPSSTATETSAAESHDTTDLLGLDMDTNSAAPAATSPPSVNLLDVGLDASAPPPTPGLSSLLGGLSVAPNALPLVPLQIDTPTFGGMWGSHSVETKLVVETAVPEISGFVDSVVGKLGASAVETIPATQEAIFAGKDKAGDTVLIHAKVQASKQAVDLMVRSQSDAVTAKVSAACKSSL